MPLRKGSSQKTLSHNVEAIVHHWKNSGKVGGGYRRSKKKAVKQAVAISMKKAGKSKRKPKLVHSASARHLM